VVIGESDDQPCPVGDGPVRPVRPIGRWNWAFGSST